MTNDEIITIAKEVGFVDEEIDKCQLMLERFAFLVAQNEREACAKVCDDINAKYKWPDDVAERVASQWCADSIRARGQA
jgi:uncharacterized protein involved in tolerance to divalent cations